MAVGLFETISIGGHQAFGFRSTRRKLMPNVIMKADDGN